MYTQARHHKLSPLSLIHVAIWKIGDFNWVAFLSPLVTVSVSLVTSHHEGLIRIRDTVERKRSEKGR